MEVDVRRSAATGRYTVHAGNVRRFGNIGTKEEAEAIAREVRAAIRPCITCGKEIISEGPHNRMCQACRQSGGNYF